MPPVLAVIAVECGPPSRDPPPPSTGFYFESGFPREVIGFFFTLCPFTRRLSSTLV